MQDKDTGKYFKDKLSDYSSPVDADGLFDAIESEIEPPKKRDRKMFVWLMGCLPLLFVVSLASYFFISSYTQESHLVEKKTNKIDDSLAIQDQANIEIKEGQTSRVNLKAETTSLQDQIINSDLETTTIDIEHSLSNNTAIKAIKEHGVERQKNIKETSDTKKELTNPIIVFVKSGDQFEREDLEEEEPAFNKSTELEKSPLRNGSGNFLDPIDQFVTGKYFLDTKRRTLPTTNFSPVELNSSENNRQKWNIALQAGYVTTAKRNTYTGTRFENWFNEYSNEEKLYGGASVILDINYEVSKNLYLMSSLDFSYSQEANTFFQVNQTLEVDDSLADTIFVDRELVGFDTIYGQEVLTIDSTYSNLITNVKLMSFGFGMGKKIPISDHFSIIPSAQIHTYIYKDISGNTVDPSGKLIPQSELEIDGERVYGKQVLMGSTFGCSFDYQFSNGYSIFIKPTYRYNFGDFAKANAIRQKRNFLSFGLGVSKSF